VLYTTCTQGSVVYHFSVVYELVSHAVCASQVVNFTSTSGENTPHSENASDDAEEGAFSDTGLVGSIASRKRSRGGENDGRGERTRPPEPVLPHEIIEPAVHLDLCYCLFLFRST